MPETYKEQQIDSLFDPKTDDDKLIVGYLKQAELIAKAHPRDVRYMPMHAITVGFAVALAQDGDTTFDAAFVEKATDEMLTEPYVSGLESEQGNEG